MVRATPGARRRVSSSLGIALVVSLSLHAAALAALVQLFGAPPSGSQTTGSRPGLGGRGGEAGRGGRAGAGIVYVELIGTANADPARARAAVGATAERTSEPDLEPQPKRLPKPQPAQRRARVAGRQLPRPTRREPEPTQPALSTRAAKPPTTAAAESIAEPYAPPIQTAARTPSVGASGSSGPGVGGGGSATGTAAAPGGAASEGPLSRVARPASEIRPRYPEAARERGDEAEVVVEAWVAASGRVERAQVRASAGREFDAAALEAVRRARFYPASRDGKPVASAVAMRLHFELAP
jgi:protein TonB